jgi:hypothetical protein
MSDSMGFYEWIERLKTAHGIDALDLVELLQEGKVKNIPTAWQKETTNA